MDNLDSRLFHIHVTTESSDCDGRYSREDTLRPRDGEDGFDCWYRVAQHALPSVALLARIEVAFDEESGVRSIEVSETTDEGGRWTRYETCGDRCPDTRRFHDHTAEAAGY